MPVIIQYLLKLSLSITVIHAFYYLFLRRLTFYNLNRWYMLGYSALCFVIPFINIASVAEKADKVIPAISYIPSVQNIKVYHAPATEHYTLTIWDAALCLLAIGSVVLLVRMAIQLSSFIRIKNKAVVISDRDTVIYHVDEQIAPFSFGNAIYLNKHMHTGKELEEIILHEYVHVKQRHTIDIILAELLCVTNWYNPFAWFMRHSIRQNLEFIADDNVVRSGMDRKAYQYHLLKVVGIPQYRIANQFNFSSLKKRIMMMNRAKTAKIHLVKFLFILPLMAVTLLAFRNEISKSLAVSKVMPAAIKTTLAVPITGPIQAKLIIEKAQPMADTIIKAPLTTKLTGVGQLNFSARDSTIIDKRNNTIELFGNATVKNLTGKISGPVIISGDGTGGDIDFSKALIMVDGKESSSDKIQPAAIVSINVLRSNEAMARYGDKAKYGALIYSTKQYDTTQTIYTGVVMGDSSRSKAWVTAYSTNYPAYAVTGTGKVTSTQSFDRTSSPGNLWSTTANYGLTGTGSGDLSTGSGSYSNKTYPAVAVTDNGLTYNSYSPGKVTTAFSGHPTASASVKLAGSDGTILSTGDYDISYIIDPKKVDLSQLNGTSKFFKENGFILKFGEEYNGGKLQKLSVTVAIDNAQGTPSASATYNIDDMQDGKYLIRILADRKTQHVSVVSVPRAAK